MIIEIFDNTCQRLHQIFLKKTLFRSYLGIYKNAKKWLFQQPLFVYTIFVFSSNVLGFVESGEIFDLDFNEMAFGGGGSGMRELRQVQKSLILAHLPAQCVDWTVFHWMTQWVEVHISKILHIVQNSFWPNLFRCREVQMQLDFPIESWFLIPSSPFETLLAGMQIWVANIGPKIMHHKISRVPGFEHPNYGGGVLAIFIPKLCLQTSLGRFCL